VVSLRRHAKTALLRDVPLFAECSRRDLAGVATLMEDVSFAAGVVLMREGEPGRAFVVIVEGTAKVTRRGRRVTDLGPGDFAGEIALVSNVPRTATVVASTPLRALVIADRPFRQLLQEQPAIAVKVMRALAARLAAMSGA
jgi:CRP/FNR family cyclic AMP-dependent transcriptional regulator